jgi:DNA-binding XRE family transcriptional regulator
MNLSKLMLNYRAKESISQRELASRCGLAYETIRKAEQGRMCSLLTETKIRRVVDEENRDSISF